MMNEKQKVEHREDEDGEWINEHFNECADKLLRRISIVEPLEKASIIKNFTCVSCNCFSNHCVPTGYDFMVQSRCSNVSCVHDKWHVCLKCTN